MITHLPIDESKFVVLQGLAEGNRFWSDRKPGEDASRLADGTVAYRVLCYTSTIEEAQTFLYGRSYTTTRDDMLDPDPIVDAFEKDLIS